MGFCIKNRLDSFKITELLESYKKDGNEDNCIAGELDYCRSTKLREKLWIRRYIGCLKTNIPYHFIGSGIPSKDLIYQLNKDSNKKQNIGRILNILNSESIRKN